MARVAPLLDRGHPVERQRAADADAEIDEQHGAGRSRAHPLDRDDAGHAPGDRRDVLAHAGRRRIGQGVDGAAAEPPAGNADEDRDHDRRGCVSPEISQRHADQPDKDRDRGNHVGAEVQRVGFERLTQCPFGHAIERSGTKEIDGDRRGDDEEGGRAGLDRNGTLAEQPLRCLENHDSAEHEQESGFDERGDAFHLAMPVLMFGVCRLAGDADGEIGEHGRGEVDEGMAGLRQDRE